MSRSTIRLILSAAISLAIVAGVVVSVQAASQNAAAASLGRYIISNTLADAIQAQSMAAKQETFKSNSGSFYSGKHGDRECGAERIDLDD